MNEMVERMMMAIGPHVRIIEGEYDAEAAARAAIEAMREPTEAILTVGADRNLADGYWRLMIDALLKG